MSKIISVFMAFIMVLTVVTPMSANSETHTFEYEGYRVDYTITGSWDNGSTQSIRVVVTNTGEDVIKTGC